MNLDSRKTHAAHGSPLPNAPDRAGAQILHTIAQLEAENNRLKAAIADSSALREQLESILRQREEEFRSQASRLVDLQRQRDEAISQLRQMQSRLAAVEVQLAEAAGTRNLEDQRAESLAGEVEALRIELESERRAASERRQGLEAELAKLKTTLIAVQHEYARLRDDVAPAMKKAVRHDQLMQVLPTWVESLLLRVSGTKVP